MMGAQCDTCRSFAPQPSAGWFFLGRQSEPSIMSVLGGSGGAEIMGTFCSLRCVAEYAYVKAVAGESATGTEP